MTREGRGVPPDAGLPRAPWADVPPETSDLLRPSVPALADAIIDAIRAQVPEYSRPLEGDFGRNVRRGVMTALETFVGLLGRSEAPPRREVYEELGRGELRDGRTLDALQSAYRTGARVALRAVTDPSVGAGITPDVALRLAEALYAYIDELADASVAGYTREQAAQAGAAQARRHALVELVARRPPPTRESLHRAAAAAGVVEPRRVALVAVDASTAVETARRMPAGSLGAGLEGVGLEGAGREGVGGEAVGLVLVPEPGTPARSGRVRAALGDGPAVVGPDVPWEEAPRSASQALRAWPLHRAGLLGEEPVAVAAEHLVALLLAGAPDLATALVERRLAPLEALTPAAQERATTTLRAWLDAHGDVTATAARLHVHSQTVRYRLGRLAEVFGPSLEDAGARLELDLALRAREVQAVQRRAPPAGGA